MRSELVYVAENRIENRFLLASVAMRAARILHIDATRTEDTINKVFTEVANNRQHVYKLPAITRPPAIDALLITTAAI